MSSYTVISEARPDSHSLPMKVGEAELPLTTVLLTNLLPGQRVSVEASIVWHNAVPNMDIGELELFIRDTGIHGQLLASGQESCYLSGEAELDFEETIGSDTARVYALTVRSSDERAIIVGPVVLKATVRA
ncbi:hypothetical protein SAMN02799630_02751 [Paenibacillus sp. UNCCL117]|uniref:hypothetical protein n=1 Tax=unclassified Paenibacillus TaxID=185978 RepID=UPI0008871047|nr:MULTISPECIES: hypothetical protein [unclassified Paenibacillus]SDD30803.1 hypothetical protein SAMN04488602_107217 [Paenibacillus sp. cl123]SFW40270.1 hypothetical protein SAMN02799630_02751 [Paenibacillus sp. UNCCL117]